MAHERKIQDELIKWDQSTASDLYSKPDGIQKIKDAFKETLLELKATSNKTPS